MKFFNKPIGITSNEFIIHLKKENKIKNKACYCGRLDPMARGNMLILENQECKKMNEYLKNNKTYEFIIVFGLATDTDDVMGLFKNDSSSTNFSILKQEKIYKTRLKSSIEKVLKQPEQKFHRYSSYMLRKEEKRKPLWKWEKMGLLKENEIPSKKVKVFNLKELKKYNTNLKELIQIWINDISIVNNRHNFRQEKIIEQYKILLEQIELYNQASKEDLKVRCIKYEIKVSSGFYVRQFICDLKKEIEYPILVYDINRVNIFL